MMSFFVVTVVHVCTVFKISCFLMLLFSLIKISFFPAYIIYLSPYSAHTVISASSDTTVKVWNAHKVFFKLQLAMFCYFNLYRVSNSILTMSKYVLFEGVLHVHSAWDPHGGHMDAGAQRELHAGLLGRTRSPHIRHWTAYVQVVPRRHWTRPHHTSSLLSCCSFVVLLFPSSWCGVIY